jgi:zinc protease
VRARARLIGATPLARQASRREASRVRATSPLAALAFAPLAAAVFVGAHAAHADAKPAPPPPKLAPPSPPSLSVPFTKYALPNGLTVILHEDHTQPTVVVNVLVKVGSRHEDKQRTGFAHLFEHLMFMGTERAPAGAFDALMEAEGGFNNAWTSEDKTDYYDVAPAHALPLLLWLEADRLDALARTMNKQKLDLQRDVVRNERRQTSENEPYGKVELRLPELLYPKGHPYHHPVIGSHEDLEAASVDDVKAFFTKWYVPKNLSLVVAGDFEPVATKATIEKLFGGLSAVAPPVVADAPTARLGSVVRETLEDDVELEKLVFAWHSPKAYAEGDAELDLASQVLTKGKGSRLYKALVLGTEQAPGLAQDVSASQQSGDLGSRFVIEVLLRPGSKAEAVEKAVLAALDELAQKPPTDAELSRAKIQQETAFVARLQSLASRASMLNLYEGSRGDPGYAERDLERYRKVTGPGLQKAASATFVRDGRVVVRVVPKPKAAAAPKPSQGGAK